MFERTGSTMSANEVVQRRIDGSLNFRPWSQYRTGFGNATGEYWLGLEVLHHLTMRANELLVQMEDFDGKEAFARYSSFSVGAESDGYRLNVSGFIDGGAGDSLAFQNGQNFSTFDKDQDSDESLHCARKYLGAFWYNRCHQRNPIGVYGWAADYTIYAVGVEWKSWKGFNYSLKTISMKIRPL